MKYLKEIIFSTVTAALTAGLFWIASNAVWAEDLERVEKLLLMDQRRDISRDLRALEKIEEPTERDKDDMAELEDELEIINAELDKLIGVD